MGAALRFFNNFKRYLYNRRSKTIMATPTNNIQRSFGERIYHIAVIMPPPDTTKRPIFRGIERFVKFEILRFILIAAHYSIYLTF